MANGTIAFDTLQTSGQITGTAKSLDTDYVVSGSTKAWVQFDQNSSLTIGESLNTTSVTDNGSAEHTVNFTNVFSAFTYIAIGGGGFTNSSGSDYNNLCTLNNANSSASAARFYSPGWSGASGADQQSVDFDYNSRIFTGDLA